MALTPSGRPWYCRKMVPWYRGGSKISWGPGTRSWGPFPTKLTLVPFIVFISIWKSMRLKLLIHKKCPLCYLYLLWDWHFTAVLINFCSWSIFKHVKIKDKFTKKVVFCCFLHDYNQQVIIWWVTVYNSQLILWKKKKSKYSGPKVYKRIKFSLKMIY